ncbi:N5-glutamine S-adenosyl-L-methionine-dependent methyltransferase [Photorhabdus australis subsp. thailandensis]|uniref:N5-glutamine S-adenosyl-L-methionine-dependent methyltransferase n=1 Tax=Photorhabdus australis subsp. thailandensis TaxID=2805096 RepID=A0A1C0U5P4_9GAMM|nr:50S ribosomal protein L11 methyltransferase [Photorhabdus australis]OCQ53250.1 N5-glutamine S-adenosyl-L-methionine-dependent methyltransferase [Photorhabdus australis subsp. thailandensis]
MSYVGYDSEIGEDIKFCWGDFFSISSEQKNPTNLKEPLNITVTPNTYPPKIDNQRADWVVTAALPAFNALSRQGHKVRNFAAIGTGAGIDALVATEILTPSTLTVTDLHEDVVKLAQRNLHRNITKDDISIHAVCGDLCEPLMSLGIKFDLIYENLPNIPLPETVHLLEGVNSSTFAIWEQPETSTNEQNYLLELHRLFLKQAKPLLTETGKAVSCIGARVPLESMLLMARTEGYEPEIIVYNWKEQSEPFDVISGYACNQQKGLGPFYFYPVDAVRETFKFISSEYAAKNAQEIEKRLAPYAIDAESALSHLNQGEQLAHTVAVIASTPMK